MTLLLLTLALALGGLPKEGEPVSILKASATLAAAIPPLDAAAPAKIGTATFALG
jgi:hypothetical protein